MDVGTMMRLKLIKELAYHKSVDAIDVLRHSARPAWSRRWWTIASVGCMKAVAEALLFERGPDLLYYTHDSNMSFLADVLTD